MREVIQISCTAYALYVLCGDGTLWTKDRDLHLVESPWMLIENVPQDLDPLPYLRGRRAPRGLLPA